MTELGVDYDALESLVESQIKGGVSGGQGSGNSGNRRELHAGSRELNPRGR